MSKKASTTLIGAFVIAAMLMIVLALVVLGSGSLSRDRQVYITHFEGSVQGLREGANVTFRGVRIGQVRKVFVQFNEVSKGFDLPVLLEIDPRAFRTASGEPFSATSSRDFIRSYIEKGLRAQLKMESFVTGQLLIDLDFYPQTQANYRSEGDTYAEIPTIPSDIQLALNIIEKILARLNQLPVEEILGNLGTAIQGVENLVNSPNLLNTLKGIDELVNRPETQQLTVKLQAMMDHMNETAETAQLLLAGLDEKMSVTSNQLSHSLQEMENFTREAQNTLLEVQAVLQDETIRNDLSRALNEFSDASRSFRILVEYLEQHPEALIKGKASQ